MIIESVLILLTYTRWPIYSPYINWINVCLLSSSRRSKASIYSLFWRDNTILNPNRLCFIDQETVVKRYTVNHNTFLKSLSISNINASETFVNLKWLTFSIQNGNYAIMLLQWQNCCAMNVIWKLTFLLFILSI